MSLLTTPIVSAKWLSENLDHPRLVILNATIPKIAGSEQSVELQIKGARFFDIKKAFSDTASSLPNTFPFEDQFETQAQKLGINSGDLIVVYDNHGIYSSPRAWWLFRSFGHDNVAVLDGGFPAWKSGGYPTEEHQIYTGVNGNFKATFQKQLIKDYKEVLAVLDDTQVKILDARARDRFDGSQPEPREGLRSGHIPSSLNLPYGEVLEDTLLSSKEKLIDHFKAYRGQELIFTCGSGITACILALGATLAGHKDMAVYDGSWTEWGGRHELPTEY